MKKKFFAALLAMAMVLVMVPFAMATDNNAEEGIGRSADKPFTSVEDYTKAVYGESGNTVQDEWKGQSVYLTIGSEDGELTEIKAGEFNLRNPQKDPNPPKLYLTIVNCSFTGNTSGDTGENTSFMYLPNCQSLVIKNCTFNSGNTELKYGINWNLCTIQDATVRIEGCTFSGTYTENAVKLNQRNGSDDMANDVKPNGWTSGGSVTAASIADAQIINCTFNGDGAVIALGSQGKGAIIENDKAETDNPDREASPTTGQFPVTITAAAGSGVKVVLDYQADSTVADEDIMAIELEAGETGSKTEMGDFGTEDDFVAEVNGEKYVSLPFAISQAEAGSTINLLKDVTLDATGVENVRGGSVLAIDKNLIINGNGKVIRGANFTSDQGDLSLINIVNGADVTLNHVIIDGSKIVSGETEVGPRHGLNIWNAGTVTLNDVTVQNNRWYGVVSNDSDLVINGLSTTGNAWGVNVDGDSTVTVNDATIEETSSIVYENTGTSGTGSLTVYDGSFQNIVVKAEDPGDSNTGTVRLIGGEFNGVTTEGSGTTNVTGESKIVTITGGTYTVTSDTDNTDSTTYISIQSLLPTEGGNQLTDEGAVIPATGSVATVNGQGFETLQAAIDAAEDGDTVVLRTNITNDNVGTSTSSGNTVLSINESITIQGNGNSISVDLSVPEAYGDRDQIFSIGTTNTRTVEVTLDGVTMNLNGKADGKGDAFDMWGTLNITNGSNITINGVQSAFTMQGGMDAKVNLDDSTVTANTINGNFSNGGVWAIEDSALTIDGAGSHGLSTETLSIDNSTVTVRNVAYVGIIGSEITLNDATVSVTNSATNSDYFETNPNGEAYLNHGAVYLKGAGNEDSTSKLTITDSTLTLSGNGNSAEGSEQIIYVGNAAVGIDANSTVNGVLERAESATGYVVTFVSNGTQLNTTVVTNGSVTMIAEPTRTGYTFGGWQSSVNQQVYRPGVSVPITADTVFTAVWNAIVVDPGERITITTPSNGSVAVSPSGGYAPAGSTVTLTVTPDRGYELGALTIRGGSSTVPYTDLGNGRYSFVMPEGGVTVSAVFTRIRFTDVPEGEWYYNAVYWAVENGVTDGTSNTLFSPGRDVTRAEMVTFLWRAAGSPEPTTTVNPFEDVSSSAYYYDAVLWAVEQGITDGVSATEFDPAGECTRAQMVTFLWRAENEPSAGTSNPFTDVDEEEYYYEAILWAAENGITNGVSNTEFDPDGECTRAQAVTFLYRTMV